MEMNRWIQVFVLFLCLCVFNFFLAGPAFCQQNWYAKTDITKNKPVVKSLPEVKIPVEVSEGGGGGYLYVILGVVLVGGVAAAMGGGGGGGGGGGDDDPVVTTGSVSVSW
jgi:hypothetical protein